jgi:hypothetical protein
VAESPTPLLPNGRLSRSGLQQVGESTARQESIFGGMPRLSMTGGESTIQGPADSFWIRIDAVGTNGQYAATEVARATGQALGTPDQPPGDARTWTLTDNPVYEINLSTAVQVGERHRAWNSGQQGTIEFDASGEGVTPPLGPCVQVVTGVCIDGSGNLIVEKRNVCLPIGSTISDPICTTNPNCDLLCPSGVSPGCCPSPPSGGGIPTTLHLTLFSTACPLVNGLVLALNYTGSSPTADNVWTNTTGYIYATCPVFGFPNGSAAVAAELDICHDFIDWGNPATARLILTFINAGANGGLLEISSNTQYFNVDCTRPFTQTLAFTMPTPSNEGTAGFDCGCLADGNPPFSVTGVVTG